MPDLQILITAQGRAEAAPQPRRAEAVPAGQVLVRTLRSLVSPGTELSFVEGKHIALPDPGNTWARYRFPAGYATIGEVVEVGADSPAAAAFRVTPIAMAIGQAGGVTAALAARDPAGSPAAVPYAEVRQALLDQGARLPVPLPSSCALSLI